MGDQVIARVVLKANSTLVFSRYESRGKHFASIRKFVTTQRYDGPTKSGFVVGSKLLRELIGVLARLERTIFPKAEHEFQTITKSATERIRVVTLPDEETDGLPSVDIREYVDTPTYQGPTKSGIRFLWNLLPDVLTCLREQLKVLNEIELREPSLFKPDPIEQEQAQRGDPGLSGPAVLTKLLGGNLKQFPHDFADNSLIEGKRIKLPDVPLRLEQDNTAAYFLRTDDGAFCKVRNPAEGNFIIYAQMRGVAEVALPKEMISIFRTVKTYENYVRELRVKVLARLLKQTPQRSVAEYEADKLFRECGLPKLEG
jgi:hypothetical protein